MKLFRQLFGSTPEPETVESQIAKLDQEPQAVLESYAAGGDVDLPASVRIEALKRLPYGGVLTNIAAKGDHPSSLEKAARERIARLVDDKQLNVTQLLKDISESDTLLAIAAYCDGNELQTATLTNITDEVQLAKLCHESSSATVRKTLVERIENHDLLKDLSKHLKTKDKVAYKIVKAKVDHIRGQQQQQESIEKNALAVCEEMEALAARSFDKDYASKLHRVQRHWNDIDENKQHATVLSEAKATRYANALAACEAVIREHEEELARLRAIEEKVSQVDGDRAALLNELWQLVNRLYSLESGESRALQDIQHAYDAQKKQWVELLSIGKPREVDLKNYTKMCNAIEILATEITDNGALVECRNRVFSREGDEQSVSQDIQYLRRLLKPIATLKHYDTCESVDKTREILASLDEEDKSRQENRQKNTKIISGLIRKANIAVDQGRLRQAIGIRHSIDEKAQLVDELPAHIGRNIESLDESIQKLVDWQNYAVVPKKEALVEAMEKLVGADVPPEALATKIKKLQDDWKSLNQSGKDRNEDLWEKFKSAADKAYAPCQLYYAELSKTRQENLAKRQTLVRQLEDYVRDYDWESADWKEVEKILRTARQELHEYTPVDRSANKPVLEAFDVAMSAIQGKLSDEYQKNKAAKEQLIIQAEKTVELTDVDQGIEAAKRLQAQWKKIGRCQYRDNENLWKQFRVHCDAIFDKKQQQRNSERAVVDERIAAATAYLTQLKELTVLEGSELLAARAKRDELALGFDAIEDLPEGRHKSLRRDVNSVLDRFDKRVSDVLQQQGEQAWEQFFELNKRINDLGAACTDEERERMVTSIAEVDSWPDGGKSLINQKLGALSADTTPSSESATSLRVLCIRAEIQSDKETPAEDKALRMEYQVKLLQQGMGQPREENTKAVLARRWVEVGVVSADEYAVLFDRFYANWRALAH